MDCSEDEGGMAGCSRGESGRKVRRGKARGGQFCGSWAAAAVAVAVAVAVARAGLA